MKKIAKIDTRSQATAYRGPAVLIAVPFVGIGTFFALAGFGVVPLPGEVNAPGWLIGFVGVAFASAGGMLGAHGVRGMLNQHRAALLRDRYGEPWFADHPWDPRGIRDHAGRRVLSSLSGTVFLAVFLVPFNWWAWASGQGPWMVKGIVGLFDLILVLAASTLVYRIGQLLRYGSSRLEFRSFPFYPGETLRVAFSGTKLERLEATLRFVEERFETHGSGRNRSTRLVSYEHTEQRKEFAAAGGMPAIEIEFEIPENREWVTALSELPVRYWELVVESERSGIDFRTTFPLPVYARPG